MLATYREAHRNERKGNIMKSQDLILCRSDAGDGGWSLHAPWATDEQIASGDAPPLTCGPSDCNEHGEWIRPDLSDWEQAMNILSASERGKSPRPRS
jgi:hypothetical protein